MGTQVLSAIADALTKQFDPIGKRQFNRECVLAAGLGAKPGRGDVCTWDCRFSRTTHATYFTEGSDVAAGEYNVDIDVPASLGWGLYRAAFAISGLALAAARTALGSPDLLLDLFGNHVTDGITDLSSQLNTAFFDGAGGTGKIYGLYGAGVMAASGAYAGIDPATYPEWASSVRTNGGTARGLTKDLIDQLEEDIFLACGTPPDLIVATSGVLRKYESLFDSVMRVAPAGNGGNGELSAARFTDIPGWTGLTYRGIPVLRDRNATSGRFGMLSRRFVEIVSLPFVEPGMADTHSRAELPAQDTMGRGLGINFKIEPLAKTGDASKFQIVSYVQLAVKRRNAIGYIGDIDES